MNTLIRLVFLFVLALVVFAPAVTVDAQDSPSVVLMPSQDGGQTPTVVVEDQSNTLDAVWLLALIPGVIAVLAIIAQVVESKNYRQTIEHISADNLSKLEGAIEQVPQAVVTQIHTINEKLIALTEGALATLKIVDKVTDGKPNEVTLEGALRRAVGDPPAMG